MKEEKKLADRAGRAFGLLKYSRLIDSNEAMQLISDVRLGVDLGLITNVPKSLKRASGSNSSGMPAVS